MPFGKLAKLTLARGAQLTGASRLGLAWQKRTKMPFIRALNYHETPDSEAHVLEAQLRFFARHFEPVGLAELRSLAEGHWPHRRPGLLLSFDDGLASHARVAAPILERHGFPGWFTIPTGFIDTPPEKQVEFARTHQIGLRPKPAAGERVAMTWDEIRGLADRHVICSHTVDHVRFEDTLDATRLERETVVSRARLEEELGRPVEAFAWVGGEETSYSAEAAAMIRKAGYDVALATNCAVFRPGDDLMSVERVNVETTYEHALTSFHLSGFYDLLYAGKRRRVQAMTRGRSGAIRPSPSGLAT